MEKFSDQKIVDSWKKNIQPWVTAIREGEIESRLLVTNKAVIDAVLTRAPKSVLDVGCGEGWLVRELERKGIQSMGVDVVPEFIAYAQKQGRGKFKCLSFETLSKEALKEQFDVVVCNFSILGNESVTSLFQKMPTLLNKGGSFIVQTIHPVIACGEEKYEDGWRSGSWKGFSDQFCDPAPWYFRTVETWKGLFIENGFEFLEILEPINPKTGKPASMVFIGTVTRSD
ncbi:MAG: methyltransferase [Saprospiraceae bacterium]|nr:MAG: methyltransferase [Saprospiraceae bacterium]